MTTSISSEAKKTESQRMKDNTENKKIIKGKTDKVSYWADVYWSKLRNEEKHFIKYHKTLFTLTF